MRKDYRVGKYGKRNLKWACLKKKLNKILSGKAWPTQILGILSPSPQLGRTADAEGLGWGYSAGYENF